MALRVNAISLADRLRTREDQILELQRHRILPTSYTCSKCRITTQKVEVDPKSNYHFYRCAGCKSKTSLRFSKLFVCVYVCAHCVFVGLAHFSMGRRLSCGLFSWSPTSLWQHVSPTSSSFMRLICLAATMANSSWAQAARPVLRLWFFTMGFSGVFSWFICHDWFGDEPLWYFCQGHHQWTYVQQLPGLQDRWFRAYGGNWRVDVWFVGQCL